MKILKLLSRKNLSILFVSFLSFSAFAEDKPIDIWNIDQNKIEQTEINNSQKNKNLADEQESQSSIYDLQTQKEIDSVQVDLTFNSNDVEIIGLYDPEDYDLRIDLWSNSNGTQLKSIFSNLKKNKFIRRCFRTNEYSFINKFLSSKY